MPAGLVGKLPAVVRAAATAAPGPVYLVGGAVRDLLLGRPVNDWDLASPEAAALAQAVAHAARSRAVPLRANPLTLRVPVEAIGTVDVVALRDDGLHADLLRQLRETTTLMEVARVLSGTLAQEDLLEAIRQQVVQVMRCSSYFLALYHEETEELDFRLLVDGGQRYPPFRTPLGRGPASVVIRERRPLLLHDLPQEAEALGLEFRTAGSGEASRSWLGVPLETRGRLLGLMAVTDYEPHTYTEADMALLENIARQVALALENSRLYEETRLRNEELERANQELLAARDRLVHAERAAALAQLSATLQHEINNPLTVVLGQTSLLVRQEDLSPEARSALEAVLDHALRIRDIMRKLQSVEDRLTTYIRDVKMIDLEGEDSGGRSLPSNPSSGGPPR